MAKIAYIFPGQGSQRVGMGFDLYEGHPSSREAFAEADEALGFELSEMCFRGTEEELALTENTQPAILTTSIAAYRAMRDAGYPEPDFVAGHSLGEYSALVAAGSLPLSDAVKMVRKRGQYMQEAVPVGAGAMAAIIGLESEAVEEGCRQAAEGGVCSPANINSPKQIVIAGGSAEVERACGILKEMGARKAIMLNVSAPFHCALMMPAQERLGVDIASYGFADTAFPIVENVSAGPNSSGARVADALTRQVSSPVLWNQTVEFLVAEGVETLVEVGAGKVLSGLVRQIDREVRCLNVEDSESLRNTLDIL